MGRGRMDSVANLKGQTQKKKNNFRKYLGGEKERVDDLFEKWGERSRQSRRTTGGWGPRGNLPINATERNPGQNKGFPKKRIKQEKNMRETRGGQVRGKWKGGEQGW